MPADNALITTDEARIHLGIISTDEPSDAWLTQIIDGISQEISDRAGRKWLPQSNAPETRIFDHDGTVVCPIDDCTAPELVRVNATPADADLWLDLLADQWTAEPANEDVKHTIRFLLALDSLPAIGRGWIFGDPQRGGALREAWPREDRAASLRYQAVEVTALWGSPVPANAKLAALEWANHIHQRTRASYSRDFQDQSANIGAMPQEIRDLVDGLAHVRPRVAAV